MSFIKYPTARQLSSELGSGTIYPVYVFIGEEEGEKEKYIERIVQKVFGETDENTRTVGNFHGEMDEFPQAIDFILSRSMFSEKKICIIRNIDRISPAKENDLLLKEALHMLPEHHVLIMTSEKNVLPRVFGRDEISRVKVYHFWKMFEKDLIAYISDIAVKVNMRIEPSAVACLIDLLGRDVRKIDEAMEILINYRTDAPVTQEIVKKCIQEQMEVSLSDFIQGVCTGRNDTLRLLKKLLDNNVHELAILAGLIRQAEQFETYHDRLASGDSPDKIMKDLGVPPRRHADFASMASTMTPERVRKMIILLYRTDYSIKSRRYSRDFTAHPLVGFCIDWLN